MKRVSVELPKEVVVNLRGGCHKGNHEWQEIFNYSAGFGEEIVTRWCSICGSVTADIDVDGCCMQPGGAMSIKSPQIASGMSYDGKGA